MIKILVVADWKNGVLKNSTAELVSKALELDAEVGGIIFGYKVESLIAKLAAIGTSTQFVADNPTLKHPPASLTTALIVDAAQKLEADQIWFTSSEMAKDIAPRVASQLEAGCCTDIIKLELDGDNLVAYRPAMAGKVVQKIRVETAKAVVIARAGAFTVNEVTAGSENVIRLTPPQTDMRTVIKEILTETGDEIDLVEANIVVSCGRGAKDEKGVAVVKGLATDLKAGFGASRAMVDAGFMPHNSQVGQTGKMVAPSLYIACGISGAIQHIAGMNSSKVVVAINTDPDAPIFELADYGIVGDLFTVIPVFQEELKKVVG